MRLLRNLLIYILLSALLLISPAQAEEQVQIFTLEHRVAADLLPQVEVLLRDGERLSTSGRHLVLIASEQTLEAATQLLSLLDHPLHQFLVQIRWTDSAISSRSEIGFDARSGVATLSTQGTVLGTSQRQRGEQVRVIEGEVATIETGADLPYAERWTAWSGDDSQGFAQETSFQRLRSGFSVVINMVSDGELLVFLTPQLMSAGNGTMLNPARLTLDRLSTQVRVVPGQWLDLASFLPDSAVGLQILSGSSEPLPAGRLLQLRVEVQK